MTCLRYANLLLATSCLLVATTGPGPGRAAAAEAETEQKYGYDDTPSVGNLLTTDPSRSPSTKRPQASS